MLLGSSTVLGSWAWAAGHTQQAELVAAERTPAEVPCKCAAYYHIIVLSPTFCCLNGPCRADTAATEAPLDDR